MILLPAIDLYEGKVVRLTRGDYSRMTVYREDPLDQAREFEIAGAAWLHTVVLRGQGQEQPPFPGVSGAVPVHRPTGGGGRRHPHAGGRGPLPGRGGGAGDPGHCRRHRPRFSPDRTGPLRRSGGGGGGSEGRGHRYQRLAGDRPEPAEAFFQRLVDWGVRTVICTDVSRDGMLGGTNVALYQSLAERLPLQLIASGGVSSLEELRRLKALGLYGAILGKALYTGACRCAAPWGRWSDMVTKRTSPAWTYGTDGWQRESIFRGSGTCPTGGSGGALLPLRCRRAGVLRHHCVP